MEGTVAHAGAVSPPARGFLPTASGAVLRGGDGGRRDVPLGGAQSSCSTPSQSRPYVRMSSISGASAWPFSVSEYSTRGGTSGKVWRSTMPCSSSAAQAQ